MIVKTLSLVVVFVAAIGFGIGTFETKARILTVKEITFDGNLAETITPMFYAALNNKGFVLAENGGDNAPLIIVSGDKLIVDDSENSVLLHTEIADETSWRIEGPFQGIKKGSQTEEKVILDQINHCVDTMIAHLLKRENPAGPTKIRLWNSRPFPTTQQQSRIQLPSDLSLGSCFRYI